MADPHNPKRYGELWPQPRIDAYLKVLEVLKPHIVLSGGWAWHFMSPTGHPEYKHAHDHKDVDLMMPKRSVSTVMGILQGLGFQKVRTRYDRLPSDEEFRRYEKLVELGHHPARSMPPCLAAGVSRLTIDFFVKDVPVRTIDGWRVVEPTTLLTFYSTIHASKSCFAVQAAQRLLDWGIDPVGRPELVEIPC